MEAILRAVFTNSTASQASYTVGSIATRTLSGDLLLAVTFSSSVPTLPTISGRGLTWSVVGHTTAAESGWYAFAVFKGVGTDTGGDITITHNASITTNYAIAHVVETNATIGAAVQANNWNDTALELSVNTSAFDAGHALAFADARGGDYSPSAIGSGWAEIEATAVGGIEGALRSMSYEGDPATASMTWASTNAGGSIVAMEAEVAVLLAEPGVLGMAGGSAALLYDRLISAERGSMEMAGGSVTFGLVTEGAIGGTVTLPGTGPIQGAVVRLIDMDEDAYVADTVTDESGGYAFTELALSKRYHVTVEWEDEGTFYHARSQPYMRAEAS